MYAINAALICFILTVTLQVWDEESYWFNKLLEYMSEYIFVGFGPLLLVLCLMELVSLHSYSLECAYDGA